MEVIVDEEGYLTTDMREWTAIPRDMGEKTRPAVDDLTTVKQAKALDVWFKKTAGEKASR